MTSGVFNGISTVLFDFDGTIADSDQLHSAAFHDIAIILGVTFSYVEHKGRTTEDVITFLLQESKEPVSKERIADLARLKRSLSLERMSSVRPVKGVMELISILNHRSYRMGVASGGSRASVLRGLHALGIESVFADVTTADDAENGKPDPEIYRTALDRLNAVDSATLAIEDSKSGIDSALSCGLRTVCISNIRPANSGAMFMSFEQLAAEAQDSSAFG